MATEPCGCPPSPASTITNPKRHAAWHELVEKQTGLTGAVTVNNLRAARGFATGTLPGETVVDVKARLSGKRASGQMRRAS